MVEKTETKFGVADFAKKLNKEYKDDPYSKIRYYNIVKNGALGLDFYFWWISLW